MDQLEVSINSTVDNPDQFRLSRPEFERRNNFEVELQILRLGFRLAEIHPDAGQIIFDTPSPLEGRLNTILSG